MEKTKINFLDLVNILTSKEMKKVTGGCANNCNPDSCSGSCTADCKGSIVTGSCGTTNWPNGSSSCTCAVAC